ncbi:class I SAM-dependent methyltransferase [Chloroflexota bacterium]
MKKLEGMLLIPFIPLLIAYWILRGTPFFFRCKWCGNPWLFLDLRQFRDGLCEKCFRAKLASSPTEFHQLLYEEIIPRARNPEFDWLFKRIARKVREGRVLDVGCETGYLLSKLNLPQGLLYGLDVTSGAIKIAKKRVEGANFSVANAINIPYKSDTFDYLLCTEVLEHIEGDAAARECYRVLKPGGVAFFIVPNGKGVAGKYMCAHIRFFSFQSIINLLREAGFKIVHRDKFGLYIPFVTSSLGFLSCVLHKDLPFSSALWRLKVPEFLSVNFYIECRKLTGTTQNNDS